MSQTQPNICPSNPQQAPANKTQQNKSDKIQYNNQQQQTKHTQNTNNINEQQTEQPDTKNDRFDKQLNQVNVDEIKVADQEQSDAQPQKCQQQNNQKSNQYKNLGNQFFKNGDCQHAIQQYRKGLRYAEDNKLRATLYSNIAICYIKLQEFKNAKKYCLKVLKQDETHRKGRMNLARCYEQQKKIQQAFQQYKKLQTNLQGATDKDIKYIKQKISSLKPKIDQLNESRKKEVMDGLKNIGNSILGYFGMSLDNFKLEQGPGGGYNVSFKQ